MIILRSDPLTCSRGEIDLEKKFEPTLLNTAIYLLGLSQQVSTFVLNFQVIYPFSVRLSCVAITQVADL